MFSIPRKHFLQFALFFISTIAIFGSCNDPEIVGLDVQPEDDRINLIYSDSSTINAFTIREDSLRSDETTLQLLGNYVDSTIFGRNDASIFAQVVPNSSAVNLGDTLALDSIVLTLAYSGFYGDTTPLTFRVYEVTEDMSYDAAYYSTKTFQYNSTELGSATITPTPNDSATVYGVNTAPHLRISLDNSFGNTLLSWSGQSQLASADTFLSHFKGLYIKVDSVLSQGGIFYFDLLSSQSKMTLYYNKGANGPGFQDSLHYDFPFAASRARMSHFSHDYSFPFITPVQQQLNDSANDDSLVYVQSMAGLKTKIRFPHLMDYIKDGMIIVNKAELEITVAENSTEHFAAPEKLLLLGVDATGNALFLADQFEGVAYYGGDYSSSTRKYKFNIGRHLQNVLKGTTQDYGLYLAVAGGSVQANRAIIYGGSSAISRMKLNLFYTKPN